MTKRELYKDIIYIDYLINNYLTIKNYGPSDDDNLNESIEVLKELIKKVSELKTINK